MFPKVAIIIGLLIIFATCLYFVSPIPQWDSYHQFSDNRNLFLITNFANVTSNIVFVTVGSYGLYIIFHKEFFNRKLDLVPYVVFFFSIILVGMGSAYYHWNPTSETLFWDRLPMSIAFMSFSAAIVCDRIHRVMGTFVVLPILILAGICSVIYWQQTEMMGVGDLRLYGLVQYFPMIAIPVILFLFPMHRYTPARPIFWVLVWYICAKLFEYFDSEILNLLNKTLSGHTLKHLAASVAVISIIKMLTNSKKRKKTI